MRFLWTVGLGVTALISSSTFAHASSLQVNPNLNLSSQTSAAVSSNLAHAMSPATMGHLLLLQASPELANKNIQLKVDSVVESAVGYHIRFNEIANGLPVAHSSGILTLSRANEVIAYQKDFKASQADLSTARFDIPEATAIRLAHEAANLTASPSTEKVEKKMLIVNGESHAVYSIRFSAPLDKKWAWEMVVDANDGHIVESNNLIHNESAEGGDSAPYRRYVAARVFDPNPTIRSGMGYGAADGFKDDDNGNSTFFDSMMSQTSIEVTTMGTQNVLMNDYVQITDQEFPVNPNCSSIFTYNYRRGDVCFDSVNAYYHITKSLKYLNNTLGISAHPILYSGPFHVDPHGVGGEDNSHYNPLTDEIAFGEGGVDDAQDHDVLLHELGHAIHNWVTHGHISQVEGLSEGIGDYWAMSYSRSWMKPNHVAYNWTFSFDGHNEFWEGRSVNVDRTYPSGVQGDFKEIHTAGELWATTCIEINAAIGRETMDKIFWSGIAMLNENSNQLEAANAIVAAAKVLHPDDSRLLEIVRSKFQARGYAVK